MTIISIRFEMFITDAISKSNIHLHTCTINIQNSIQYTIRNKKICIYSKNLIITNITGENQKRVRLFLFHNKNASIQTDNERYTKRTQQRSSVSNTREISV